MKIIKTKEFILRPAKINDVKFLKKANLFPNIIDSAGNCIIPTVTHATKKAVTAIKLVPKFNNSPPKI